MHRTLSPLVALVFSSFSDTLFWRVVMILCYITVVFSKSMCSYKIWPASNAYRAFSWCGTRSNFHTGLLDSEEDRTARQRRQRRASQVSIPVYQFMYCSTVSCCWVMAIIRFFQTVSRQLAQTVGPEIGKRSFQRVKLSSGDTLGGDPEPSHCINSIGRPHRRGSQCSGSHFSGKDRYQRVLLEDIYQVS